MAAEHEVSVPPSPPPPPPRGPLPSGVYHEHQAGDLQDALRIGRQARKLAQDLDRKLAEALGREPDPKVPGDDGTGILGRIASVEIVVGSLPDPVRKLPASGMIALMLTLQETLAALQKELGADREAREKSAATSAAIEVKRAESRARLAWGIGIPVAVAIVLGALAIAWRWASTLHH